MYCKYCGAKLKDEHADCPKCGKNNRLNSSDDAKDFRFALLGFLVPIAGLVLYLVWKKDFSPCGHPPASGARQPGLCYTSVCPSLLYCLLF